jgi:hypothetical protein
MTPCCGLLGDEVAEPLIVAGIDSGQTDCTGVIVGNSIRLVPLPVRTVHVADVRRATVRLHPAQSLEVDRLALGLKPSVHASSRRPSAPAGLFCRTLPRIPSNLDLGTKFHHLSRRHAEEGRGAFGVVLQKCENDQQQARLVDASCAGPERPFNRQLDRLGRQRTEHGCTHMRSRRL